MNWSERGLRAAGLLLPLNLALLPAAAAAPKGAGAPPPVAEPWVALVAALAWPVAALLIAVVFRRPLSALVSAIGGRITKVSLFKVEIELLPAEKATAPLLNDLKSAAVSTAVNDSSAMMLQQVQEGGQAQFAIVDLGAGEEWLTSRLYIAAIMLERMRGVQAFLFVEQAQGIARRFVAIAPAARVRWALAQQYPWLEAAWLNASHAMAAQLDSNDPNASPVIKSAGGALETNTARNVVRGFITALGAAPGTPPPPADKAHQWVTLKNGRRERACWLGRSALEALLPQESLDAWAPAMRDAPRGNRARAILRRPGDFVALVEADRQFAGLVVDRRALIEQLAAIASEEPEAS